MTETETQQFSVSGRPLPKRWFAIIVTIWSGQAVSMLTSYAAGFAAVWYVTETTGSAWMLSVLMICAYLPQGLLSPFGGILADRFNRRTIMICADLGVGIISLILGIAILVGQASVLLIALMAIARSVGQAFHSPAMLAAMPMLVPQKHLMRINTLDQLLISICSIGAPAFGILLYTTLGFHSVMFLDFFGALIAVGALLLVKIPTVHNEEASGQGVMKNLAEGWRVFASNRGLLILVIGITLGVTASAPLSAFFPLMTYDTFSGDGYMASIVEASFGAGMIVGSIVLMIWGGGKHLVRLIAVASVLVGSFTFLCGLLTPNMFVVFVVLASLMAVFSAWFNAPMITLVQRNTTEEKMGRAMGFITALFGIASPIGVAIGGAVAEEVGLNSLFLTLGIVIIIAGIVIYSFKSVRALDEQEPAPAQIPNA